ncbi:hypothetical protein J6590_089138 [Homalodisca vitripennis]|nr:hypothetical protein J6590_090480 [Homalodisca vitripennis]KAG8295059.1 hypothetical protein J6590_089138 [Homalodisca vitripennis]
MAGQAGRLQGQDRSAVTCPSSSHARRCLIWLSCDNRRTHYTAPLAQRNQAQTLLKYFDHFPTKLICSVIDAPDLLELLDFRVSRHLRHSQMFARRHSTTQYMFHSAFPHLQRLANNLPRHQDFYNMSCVTFKRELRLACHDLHIV